MSIVLKPVMETESDPINEYKSSLNELSFNSKPLINMLTMLSEDYKDSKAPQIVRCIEQRLHSVSADKKLPILYLLDSICKNVGTIYVNLFTQNIVSTFCDVFEKVDEKTRLSLYKLRQTWSTIFPARKLYAIDHRIHSTLDPAWPITAPKPSSSQTQANSGKPSLQSVVKQPNTSSKTSSGQTVNQQQVHINPKFLNDKKPLLAADPQAELAKQLIQKQNELLQIQKQKLQFDLLAEKKKLAEQARALQEKELKLKQKEEQMLRSNSPNGKKVKKRKRSHSQRSRSPSPLSQKSPGRSRSPSHRWSQSPQHQRESPQQSPSFAMRQNKVHRRSRSPKPSIKPFITSQTAIQTPIVAHPSSALPSTTKLGTVGQPPVPTTIPAPTILAQPEMLNIQRMDTNVVTTMSSIIPITSTISDHNVMSGHINNNIDRQPFLSWGQDRDYRRELDSMMSQANEKLRSGAISSTDHDVLIREMERHMRDAQNITTNNVSNRVIAEPLDTLTMYVDGELRKLYYLDDTTAVVLRKAPPNVTFDQLIRMDPRDLEPCQISFQGKPTYVFIDSDRPTGETFLLDFNGQEYVHYPKDPTIPPQKIKFGGPAKEIILNGQPFPAKFGGPPIQVWFEGDSNGPHTIRLDGPTPRVNLSKELRYDLWNKIINRANTEIPKVNNTNSAPPPTPAPDVNTLLSQLIAAGIIDNSTQKDSSKAVAKEENKEVVVREKVISNDPPIELSSDSLKICRPSVVAELYRGIQCTNCSLRFDDSGFADKNRYSKHLDWHFRQNRRDKAKPNSSAASMRRNWYYPLNLWVQFKEVTDEEDTTGLFQNEEHSSDDEEEQPFPTVITEKDESLNFCAVCHEKFDQQWNEEEEEWRLQNAVKHNTRIYHPFCLKDFITQTERHEQQLKESLSDHEIKQNSSDESIKTDIKAVLNSSDNNCDNISEQNTIKNDLDVKSEPNIDTIDSNVSEVKPELTEDSEQIDEKPIPSEESSQESNIKVFEFEIPLNSDNEIKSNLADILEAKEVVDDIENQIEIEEEKSVNKVVKQQGGIVIKMKASNLQTPATVQPSEPMETEDNQRSSEVVVKGQELSSLCNIM